MAILDLWRNDLATFTTLPESGIQNNALWFLMAPGDPPGLSAVVVTDVVSARELPAGCTG